MTILRTGRCACTLTYIKISKVSNRLLKDCFQNQAIQVSKEEINFGKNKPGHLYTGTAAASAVLRRLHSALLKLFTLRTTTAHRYMCLTPLSIKEPPYMPAIVSDTIH